MNIILVNLRAFYLFISIIHMFLRYILLVNLEGFYLYIHILKIHFFFGLALSLAIILRLISALTDLQMWRKTGG